MKKTLYVALFAAFTLGFAACQKDSKKQAVSGAVVTNDLTQTFQFPQITSTNSQSCSTCSLSAWSTSDLNTYCTRLQDHSANSFCAEEVREQLFNSRCSGTFVRNNIKNCSNSASGQFPHTQMPHENGTAGFNMDQSDINRYVQFVQPFISRSTYQGFVGLGCTTGMEQNWKYNNIADFCSKIQDDTLNAGCAHQVRREVFNIYCTNQGTYQTKNEYYQFNLAGFNQSQWEFNEWSKVLDFSNGLFEWDPVDKVEYTCDASAQIRTDNVDEYCDKVNNSADLNTTCFTHPTHKFFKERDAGYLCN